MILIKFCCISGMFCETLILSVLTDSCKCTYPMTSMYLSCDNISLSLACMVMVLVCSMYQAVTAEANKLSHMKIRRSARSGLSPTGSLDLEEFFSLVF